MRGRILALAAAAAAALSAAIALPGAAGHPTCVRAAGEHHVAVVVEHSSGAVITRCVSFGQDSLTGQQVMDLSGIEYQTVAFGGLGAAVCQVDYEPRTFPSTCWTSTGPYWGMYFSRAGGAWAISQRGISSQTFQDGDALGWHYQPQSGAGGGPPPSAAGVCAAAAAPAAAPAQAAGPQPPSAAPGSNPVASASAPAAAPQPPPSTPGESTPATAAGEAPTTAPRGAPELPAARRAAHPSVDAGVLAASLAAGALAGLLMLRLVVARLWP